MINETNLKIKQIVENSGLKLENSPISGAYRVNLTNSDYISRGKAFELLFKNEINFKVEGKILTIFNF